MRKLRLIKPWRLQTRRQKTGYDRLEIMCSTAEPVSCRGPQENAWLDEMEMSNPRTVSFKRLTVAAPRVMSDFPRNEKGPRA